MSDFYCSKDVVTRKEHKCGFCNRVIPKGTKTKFASGMFEGEFFNSYLDDFCKEILDIFHDDYSEDGYNEDCFAELELNIPCCECGNYLYLRNNDIKNRQIIFECEECEIEVKMDYEEVLEGIRKINECGGYKK